MNNENTEFENNKLTIGFNEKRFQRVKNYDTILVSVIYFDDKGMCIDAEAGCRSGDTVDNSVMDSFKDMVRDWIEAHNKNRRGK
ncbi:MAG: hypothetical protein IKO41_21400 [Lachnospiraceae bacterium]|nr:hypothetical protein [Lachnospiraceae bacterium]